MTINEAIGQLDSGRNNAFSRLEKIMWLDRLDRQVALFMANYENAPLFSGYTADTPGNQQLLLSSPFDEAYLRYMEAQMDYQNGEFTRFNNAIGLFHSAISAFENHYNRTNMPIGGGLRYF